MEIYISMYFLSSLYWCICENDVRTLYLSLELLLTLQLGPPVAPIGFKFKLR